MRGALWKQNQHILETGWNWRGKVGENKVNVALIVWSSGARGCKVSCKNTDLSRHIGISGK
jgi:hypothetical protein